ncbi:outer membrane beta-barrel protein [Luteolibacter sp. GHJ8]|uniref:Outer membrane beta-barrel protein n=1 Tax=Luteolibacter rhizosphaerae TaxID=2989719 RepID=A0ABT3FYU5_9BACT|nr:outer membrane beta-barrel protein [Luteolibacter rhizosphaerae]MCW1912757.1 outer membrane beta-barrel protein [Luteolibacter rhizosphaerae]
MKRSFLSTLAAASAIGAAQASLYHIQDEAQESIPLKWTAGVNLTWDDNVNPTATGVGANDDAVSVNPFVGLSFVSITPQTTLDVYARVGAIYYFDEPEALGSEDIYGQARAGVNLTHRFSERLRFSSRNHVSYELEPDYSYGYATSRQVGEYLYWQTDNSVGYRWSERLGTYTGFTLSGLDYDSSVPNADRFTWTVYNQFRYQLTEQTVLTADYRYSETSGDGLASDSTNHYLLGGVEHRFTPNTIMIARIGAQFREVDDVGADETTDPYAELAFNTRVNEQFMVRSFLRYGIEDYDTVVNVFPGPLVEFDSRQTLRIGVTGEYELSQALTIFGGVDYITTDYEDGRNAVTSAPVAASASEDIINAYVGVSLKFTENLYGNVSYNYTDSSSDLPNRSYDRNRVNLGVRAEF